MPVRNSRTLMHDLAHHAKELQPVVGTLAIGMKLQLDDLGWELNQVKEGSNSYFIKNKRVGKQYHFRVGGTRGKMFIFVMDSYFKGVKVDTIRTRVDAIRFIQARVAES
jgi:hypothetical protein